MGTYLLCAALSGAAVEVTISPPSPVHRGVVLESKDVVPIAAVARIDEAGVLFHTGADYWFSLIGPGSELTTAHLAAVAESGAYGLPADGAVFWTGESYLVFWSYGDEVFLARLSPRGSLLSTESVFAHPSRGHVEFVAAWNESLGLGMIVSADRVLIFTADGSILDESVLEALPEERISVTSLIPYGEGFAAVTVVRTPSGTGRPVVESINSSGTGSELIRFEDHATAIAAPCGDGLIVLEFGNVHGHRALNSFRIDRRGSVTAFETLWETPDEVPQPLAILGCDETGFRLVSQSGSTTSIDLIRDGEVVNQGAWERIWPSAFAMGNDFALLAGRTSYRWYAARPDELVETPLLLSAPSEVPLAAESRERTDAFLIEDRGSQFLLTIGPGGRSLRPLPPNVRDADIGIAPDGKRILIAFSGESGIAGITVDLADSGTLPAPHEISNNSGDRNPTVVGASDGFWVAWSRQVYRDTSTERSAIVARRISATGHPATPELVLLPGEETGHYSPLLRAWRDGYLLLTSRGTVCWRLGCAFLTPLDLEATRLDRYMQLQWTSTVASSPEHDEIPRDAECVGDRCFAVWSRVGGVNDACLTFVQSMSVGAGLLHEQGFSYPSVVLDEPELNDLDPTVGLIDDHWFVAWVTEGRPACGARKAADLRGSVFGWTGTRLPIEGEWTVPVASRPQGETQPHLLADRLFFSMTTPEAGTGAAERLHVLSIEIGSESSARRRPAGRGSR